MEITPIINTIIENAHKYSFSNLIESLQRNTQNAKITILPSKNYFFPCEDIDSCVHFNNEITIYVNFPIHPDSQQTHCSKHTSNSLNDYVYQLYYSAIKKGNRPPTENLHESQTTENLIQKIKKIFPCINIHIQEFTPTWMTSNQKSILSNIRIINNALGENIQIGEKTLDASITISATTDAALQNPLATLEQIKNAVKNYLGASIKFEFRIAISNKKENQFAVLGSDTTSLGQQTWLGGVSANKPQQIIYLLMT